MHALPTRLAQALVVFCLLASPVAARGAEGPVQQCACARCGQAARCQTVCRCVTETKKVEVVCWGFVEEDFCVPCPSQECETHCEPVCVDCDQQDGVQSQPKEFLWTRWLPTKSQAYTRRKLMKRTITKEVPSTKWVYEDVCDECVRHASHTAATGDLRTANPGQSTPLMQPL